MKFNVQLALQGKKTQLGLRYPRESNSATKLRRRRLMQLYHQIGHIVYSFIIMFKFLIDKKIALVLFLSLILTTVKRQAFCIMSDLSKMK